MAKSLQAYDEASRIFCMSAFTVKGYSTRRNVNQYATMYHFPDGSALQVSHKRIYAWVPWGDENPLILPSKVNARSKIHDLRNRP